MSRFTTLPKITGLAFFLTATSASAGDVAPQTAPAATLVLGHHVQARRVHGTDEPFLTGDRAVAFSEVAGVGSGFVEHIWYRDGKEVARHYLPVGSGKRWRTWSRHTLQAGAYVVEVLAPDGTLLARRELVVYSSDEGC